MDWLNIVQTIGLPVAGLIFTAWVSVSALKWTGREVVIPIRDRLIERTVRFFDNLEQHNVGSKSLLQITHDMTFRIEEAVQEVNEKCTLIKEQTEMVARWRKPPSDPPPKASNTPVGH